MNNLLNINKVLPAKEKRVPLGTIVWINHKDSLYILGQPEFHTVVLISLTDGNRWEDPIKYSPKQGNFYNETVGEDELDSLIKTHGPEYTWGYIQSVEVEADNE